MGAARSAGPGKHRIEVVQSDPGEQAVGIAVVGAVIVGERHQNHKQNRQHREDDDARHRQRQQRLVELIVDDAAQVVLAALQFLAGGENLLCNLVLPDVHPPCVDERKNKEDRQNAVQQNLEGVVVIGRDENIQIFVIDLAGPDLAEGRQHTQPVSAGQNHVPDKHDFKKQEQQPPKNLSPGDTAKAHDEKGKLGFPVPVNKSAHNIRHFSADGRRSLFQALPDFQEEVTDSLRNSGKEATEFVSELCPFGKSQILQITELCHIRDPLLSREITSKTAGAESFQLRLFPCNR